MPVLDNSKRNPAVQSSPRVSVRVSGLRTGLKREDGYSAGLGNGKQGTITDKPYIPLRSPITRLLGYVSDTQYRDTHPMLGGVVSLFPHRHW